jgi:hypothetical protein
MVLGKLSILCRCIGMNQDELGIEKLTLAVALNNEEIEGSTT